MIVATDGSCLSNPDGPTGWAWVADDGRWRAGAITTGTNNIGELWGVLAALRDHPATDLTIQTDSAYALTCIDQRRTWEAAGWRTKTGAPVANRGLVRAIDTLIKMRQSPPQFVKVQGHDTRRRWPLNEHADTKAGWAAREAKAGRVGESSGQLPLRAVAQPRTPPAHAQRGSARPRAAILGWCDVCGRPVDMGGRCGCS